MYNTIVVGYDDSDYSKAALLEVSGRVKRHGGKVVLVHAVFFDEEEFGIAPVQLEKRFELGRNVCYQAREKYSAEFGIDIETIVCQGEPAEIIAEVASARDAGLVAMGTHGRRGLKRLIMGSVTSSVIAASGSDVLVVKKHCKKCEGQYRSVLVAYDGSAYSKKALERAGAFAKDEGAEITVLYVIPRYEEMIGFFKTDSIRKSLADEAEKVLDTARETARRMGFPMAAIVQEGSSAEKVAETAAKLKSDLVIMGTFGWTGVDKAIMGSTTERVIVNSPSPVLVVR